jgi:ATP-dependent DNA helicase RecG
VYKSYGLSEKGIVKFVEENGNHKTIPTGMGLLLFGREPRERFPQAVLKAEVRYGNEEPEIRDFDEPLVLIPDEIDQWLKKVLRSKIVRERFEREEIPEFPIEVIREAVINAIVHRDYDNKNAKSYLQIDDDKIVIKSPGKPVDPIKLEILQKFEAPSLSRNPVLSHIFNQMGFAEERGIGMRTLKSLPEKYNLPLPQYSYEEPFLTLTFPRSFYSIKKVSGIEQLNELNDEELKGYEFICPKNKITKREYANHFDYSDRQAERHLKRFTELGLIERKGAGPSTHYIIIPT